MLPAYKSTSIMATIYYQHVEVMSLDAQSLPQSQIPRNIRGRENMKTETAFHRHRLGAHWKLLQILGVYPCSVDNIRTPRPQPSPVIVKLLLHAIRYINQTSCIRFSVTMARAILQQAEAEVVRQVELKRLRTHCTCQGHPFLSP